MPPLENVLPGKPWYFGLILGLVAFVAILAAVHYGLVTDIDSKISSAQSELDELQKKIAAGKAAQARLPELREQVAQTEQELEKLRRILPSTRNTEEIIKKIKSLVDQGNLDLKQLSFPDPVPSSESDVYADWNISISLEGTYHNLAILFDRLSNFSRIINVEKFAINALSVQTEKTISATFDARTFVYIEKDAAAAAAAPAAKTPGGAK